MKLSEEPDLRFGGLSSNTNSGDSAPNSVNDTMAIDADEKQVEDWTFENTIEDTMI